MQHSVLPANSAYALANTISSGAIDNYARPHVNAAFTHANSSFDAANTADSKAVTAGSYANSACGVANTQLSTSGGTISGDLSVTGNLTVLGNATSIAVSSIKIDDSLIQLAANNESSDTIDIGFFGHYSPDAGVSKKHTGLFRDANDGRYYLFYNYEDPSFETLSPNNVIDVANSTFRVANLTANVITDVISIRGYDPINYTNTVYTHANASYSAANTAISDALAFAIALG